MKPASHERITIELHGQKAALIAHARARGHSPSSTRAKP